MRKTKNGSYHIWIFEVFPFVKSWHWGTYMIGTTKVYMLGPTRIFVKEADEN